MKSEPRLHWCWNCGRKLRSKPGGGFSFVEIEIDEHKRILHLECAKRYKCIAEKHGRCLSSPAQQKPCEGTNTKCPKFHSYHNSGW